MLDDLRRKNPTLGFAAYALEPDGPVTLEVHTFGLVATFEAPSLARCIEKAFPPAPKPSNELSPLPPRPAPPTNVDLPDIPEFLRRTEEKKSTVAPGESPSNPLRREVEAAQDNSVFD